MTLEKLHLTVHIDRDAAILQGHGQVGTVRVPIEPVIAVLKDFDAVASVNFSPDTAVEWLASHVRGSNGDLEICFDGSYGCNTKRLRSATPEVKMEDLAAQILRLHGEWIADKNERQAKVEAEFEAAMAAPIESWIDRDSYSGRPSIWKPMEKVLTERKLYQARRAEAESLLAALLPAWEAEQAAKVAEEAEEKAAKEAAAAAEAERKELHKAYIRSWVEDCEEMPSRLRRAAREQREVAGEALRLVTGLFREAVIGLATTTLGQTDAVLIRYYGKEVRTDVPSDAAYQLHDALLAGAESIAKASLLPGATVEVGPFVRLDVEPRQSSVWRSAVRVTLRHDWLPGGKLTLHPLSEPLDYEPARDDDE